MSDTTAQPTPVTEPAIGPITEPAAELASASTFAPEEIESPQDRLIDSVTASQQEVIDSAESAGTALVEGLGLVQLAMSDFLADRVRQSFETQRALLGSRSLDEARSIGFAHVHATVDQYGRAVSRMVRLGTTVTRRSLDRPHGAQRRA